MRAADKTGKIGPGRVVSWKKHFQPGKELGGCGTDGKDVLKSGCGLCIKSGPDPSPHLTPHVGAVQGRPPALPQTEVGPPQRVGA